MKIAICLSGAPRTIERSLHSISLIKSTGDTKVFIHTWAAPVDSTSIEGEATSPWPQHQKRTHKDVIENFSYEKIQLDWFESTSKFIKNYKEKCSLHMTQIPNALAPFCMFYSFQQVEKLKSDYEAENNMVFDIVYRMRFDSCIFTPELLPTTPFEQETLAVPHGKDYHGLNDQFAYGTSQTMKKYFNSFSIFPTLPEKHFYNPESLLLRCVSMQNLPLVRTPLRVGIHDNNY